MIFICRSSAGAVDANPRAILRECPLLAVQYFLGSALLRMPRLHQFWIRGLQVSLTKTKDKVFRSGRLNLYTPGFHGGHPAAPRLKASSLDCGRRDSLPRT